MAKHQTRLKTAYYYYCYYYFSYLFLFFASVDADPTKLPRCAVIHVWMTRCGFTQHFDCIEQMNWLCAPLWKLSFIVCYVLITDSMCVCLCDPLFLALTFVNLFQAVVICVRYIFFLSYSFDFMKISTHTPEIS